MFQAPAAASLRTNRTVIHLPNSPARASSRECSRRLQPLLRPRKRRLRQPPSVPRQGPGEFTRMFRPRLHRRCNCTARSQDRPFITPDRPLRHPEPRSPGLVSSLGCSKPHCRRSSETTPADSCPTGRAKPAEPGEFTRFFQTPQQSTTPAAHPAYKDPFAKAQEPTAPESGVG